MGKKSLSNHKTKRVIFTVLSVLITAAIAGCGSKNDVDKEMISQNQTEEYASGETDHTTVTNQPEEISDGAEADPLEEAADLTFADLSKLQFEFSSGAGAWAEEFTIEKDGSLRGSFSDSDMGDIGDGYPNGTTYCSSYTGHFTDLQQINEYTYEMKLADISYVDTVGTEEIYDEMRYVYVGAYCLGENDTFKVYLPGTPISELSELEYSWISYSNESETELTMMIIVDEENEYAIYSCQRPDPLEDAKMTFGIYQDSYDYYDCKYSEAETTVEMAECAELMYKASDDCLNYIWHLIKYNVDEDKFTVILDEQREWIAQNEKQAKEITSLGGSMAAVDCNRVMAERTIERCEELIAYLER